MCVSACFPQSEAHNPRKVSSETELMACTYLLPSRSVHVPSQHYGTRTTTPAVTGPGHPSSPQPKLNDWIL